VVSASAGLSGSELELAAGQHTLARMVTFPGILIVLFLIFFIWQKRIQKAKVLTLAT
jgi:hypothetical protein